MNRQIDSMLATEGFAARGDERGRVGGSPPGLAARCPVPLGSKATCRRRPRAGFRVVARPARADDSQLQIITKHPPTQGPDRGGRTTKTVRGRPIAGSRRVVAITREMPSRWAAARGAHARRAFFNGQFTAGPRWPNGAAPTAPQFVGLGRQLDQLPERVALIQRGLA